MRRLLHYLINNIREHLMLYLFLWGLLAIMDLIYVCYF
ncbi:YceO family protein [Escherichia coli]|nr:YceO family protein [Escherichia coli]EJE3887361.1 YceO family protein [Escherichia coli]HBH9275248.1 YceO family protein [Escherichia coli]